MNRKEAVEYVKITFGDAIENNPDSLALLKIRQENCILPEFGVDGSKRDRSEWVLIDMEEKSDTGLYGSVHYFGFRKTKQTNLEKFEEVFGWEPSTKEPLADWWANDAYIAP